ncbi:MAG: archease [Candidatus Woesearchaeota archaeon]|jgi:SHS2 domain-containing protein
MKPYYKYLEHTADVLFQAEASTLAELFNQCGLAVEETMIELKRVLPKRKVLIKRKNKNIEYLLFDFLGDLIILKDSRQLLFSKFEIEIKEKIKKNKESKIEEKEYQLICRAYGEKLDVKKHEPKVDIKAITMHMFEVKQTKNGWFAEVLVDI